MIEIYSIFALGCRFYDSYFLYFACRLYLEPSQYNAGNQPRPECQRAFKESVWTFPRWLDNSHDLFEPVTMGTRLALLTARTDGSDEWIQNVFGQPLTPSSAYTPICRPTNTSVGTMHRPRLRRISFKRQQIAEKTRSIKSLTIVYYREFTGLLLSRLHI